MKAKNLINQLTKLGFYIVDDEFFNEDELEQYGVCTLQNDNNLNIDYINITYDDYEILGYIEIGINGKNKLVKPSKLIDVLKLYESKKYAKKALKESIENDVDKLNNLKNQINSYAIGRGKVPSSLMKQYKELIKKLGNLVIYSDNEDKWILNESKKSVRKLIKGLNVDDACDIALEANFDVDGREHDENINKINELSDAWELYCKSWSKFEDKYTISDIEELYNNIKILLGKKGCEVVEGWIEDIDNVFYSNKDLKNVKLNFGFGGNDLFESKKSARKSLKESRDSILDKEFYDLVEEGYIYDEDENGMNMSYGEYASISDDLWEVLEDELKRYRDFPSAYDAYIEIMDNTSDDAKMFMSGINDDFYFSIDEDEGTYTFSGEVPFILEKLFKEFQKETDLEMA